MRKTISTTLLAIIVAASSAALDVQFLSKGELIRLPSEPLPR